MSKRAHFLWCVRVDSRTSLLTMFLALKKEQLPQVSETEEDCERLQAVKEEGFLLYPEEVEW